MRNPSGSVEVWQQRMRSSGERCSHQQQWPLLAAAGASSLLAARTNTLIWRFGKNPTAHSAPAVQLDFRRVPRLSLEPSSVMKRAVGGELWKPKWRAAAGPAPEPGGREICADWRLGSDESPRSGVESGPLTCDEDEERFLQPRRIHAERWICLVWVCFLRIVK